MAAAATNVTAAAAAGVPAQIPPMQQTVLSAFIARGTAGEEK